MSKVVDTDYVLELTALEEFIDMNHESVDMCCMDISDKVTTRVTDEQARALIRKIAKCGNISDFQEMDIVARDKCLKKLYIPAF